MRPSSILRALPILPPRDRFPTYFYTKAFAIVLSSGTVLGVSKGKQARTGVADERFADQLVKSFGIKDGSTVIEAYPGLGYLTRSLLRSKSPHIPKIIALEPSLALAERALGFPSSIHAGLSHNRGASGTLPGAARPLGPVEGVPGAVRLHRGGSARSDMVLYEMGVKRSAAETEEEPESMVVHPHHEQKNASPLPALQYDPTGLGDGRLIVGDEAMFHWGTFQVLKEGGYLNGVKKTAWEDDESPDLHFVCQVPDAELGEQMVNQWIGCMATRSWMFEYGPVKMSLVVSPTLYARLIAPVSSKAHTKMSVIRQALCDIVPSSPNYPHSPILEVSASQKRAMTKRRKDAAALGGRVAGGKVVPGWADELAQESTDQSNRVQTIGTITLEHPDDAILSPSPLHIYPPIALSSRRRQTELSVSAIASETPLLYGLTLIPKKSPPVDGGNKDAWDYVVRRMFVLSGQKLEVAIANLGPGAKNLLPLLTDKNLPSHQQIEAGKIVRELTIEDWTNLIRAFQGWKFAPDLMMLGPLIGGDKGDQGSKTSRVAGSGM